MEDNKVLKVITISLFIVLFISLAIYIPYEYFYNSRIYNLNLSLGDKYVLNLLDKDLNYESSDDTIATVDNNGIISVINFGEVKITVKDKNNKMKYRYDLTIEDDGVSSLELYPLQLELKTGDTYQLIHKYISKNKPESIVWESSNKKAVTIDENGVVKGIAEGSSTITLTIDGLKKECLVSVSAVNNPVEPNYIAKETPKQTQTTTTTKPSTQTQTQTTTTTKPSTQTQTQTTTTTKPSTQTQTQTQPKQEVKKEEKPQAIITTNKEEIKTEIVVDSIKSDITSKSIYVGETYQIVTIIVPNDAKTTLSYTSSNTKIATVTDKGLVKGVSKGNSTITVKSANDKSYTIQVTVNEVVKTPEKKTFKATLVANGAVLSKDNVTCTTTSTNCKVTLPSFTRDGYTIMGYSTSQNATSAEYKIGDSVNIYSDATYYAITSKTVTATFLPTEYVSNSKASCTMYNANTTCNVETPSVTRANYVSLGFNTNSNAANGTIGSGKMLAIGSNATYYAITKINQDGIVAGCTGWAAGSLNYYTSPNGSKEGTLSSGTAFTIEELSGQYFKVSIPGKSGYKYVKHDNVMINLSDYIPSMVFNITNASSSIYKSSGINIPGITGTKLYTGGKVYNLRLRREEYMAPMIYSTAKLLLSAENTFKSAGYRIKVYDVYRPHSVTVKIYNALKSLYDSNATVKENIDYSTGASGKRYYWGKDYFLANGVSRHNLGIAIDATLVNSSGQEVQMPTAMHELSTKAIKYYSGSVAKVPANYSKEMNDIAKYYDKVMTGVGFNTISGEWWHFQENAAASRTVNCDFQVTAVYSY